MTKVVIIGGGYGGLKAVGKLANRGLDITLIDQNNYHYLQTEAYDFIANKCNISDMTVDIASFCKGYDATINFVLDSVIYINKTANSVTCENGSYEYDYLIIASGAKTNFPHFIDGLLEYSNGVKTLVRALEFKQRFENTIYNYIKNRQSCSMQSFNIVVGGAGLSGVEIAAEMNYILKQYLKVIGMKCEGFTITLIDAAPSILPGMDKKVIEFTQKRLQELGVKLLVNSFISKVEPNSLSLQSGEDIPFDFMIFTGGIEAMNLGAQEGEVNRFGQYVVDDYYRIKGSDNIFAIGDVAQIKDGDTIIAPTAQSAEQGGIFCAGNILRRIKGQKMQKRLPKIYGYFIALGGKYAVGTLFGRVVIKGYSAYLLKRFITVFYKKLLKRKVEKGYEA
ncbi:MAG: NAD(P)/FAD-dependent oxidoreductase [Campylobacterota bacterium]